MTDKITQTNKTGTSSINIGESRPREVQAEPVSTSIDTSKLDSSKIEQVSSVGIGEIKK